jgi:hypothetical protein|tara:strand:- start:688 stop:972 length:285 start_codon:yes stop_codon:yes gene_type:complete
VAKKKVVSDTTDSEVLLLLSFKKEYDTLKVDNPLGISRLKRKTVLEYLSQRIVLLAQEIEDTSKARVFLQDQKDKLDADSKATKSYEKLDEDYN